MEREIKFTCRMHALQLNSELYICIIFKCNIVSANKMQTITGERERDVKLCRSLQVSIGWVELWDVTVELVDKAPAFAPLCVRDSKLSIFNDIFFR